MTLSNLNEFKSKFQTYGFSMANLYDVQIDVGGSSKLFDVLQGKFRLAAVSYTHLRAHETS